MNDSKKKLLLALKGIKHYDAGGNVTGGGTTVNSGMSNGQFNEVANPTKSIPNLANPTKSIGSAFQLAGSINRELASALTTQDMFQASMAPTDYTNYGQYIDQSGANALSGYGNFQNIQGQQQGLANQLGDQAQGRGPNPVQNALAANTGNNIASQAALMAGQRGAGANVGLMARQAAQQGAQTQQQQVGQAATLQAQQQLAAQQQLQQQQALMASGNVAEQNANNAMFTGAAGAQNTQNANTISNFQQAQKINADTAAANAAAVNKTGSGLLGGAASLMGMLAEGGEVAPQPEENNGVVSSLMHGIQALMGGVANAKMSSGGSVGSKLKTGGSVPGTASVAGNSFKNDTVQALLSPGEGVIDRETMNDKGPMGKAARALIQAIQAKKRK